MSHGRKQITCNKCKKLKINYGLGMCSACLRNHKRKTRPGFYLGTCYSEMSRRVRTFDPLRPSYFGKNICSREEFISKFLADTGFLTLYKAWQAAGYVRRAAPSIDRMNNALDYTLDNLKFVSHYTNSTKDVKLKVSLFIGEKFIQTFESQLECANYLNLSPATICKAIQKNVLVGKVYRVIRV